MLLARVVTGIVLALTVGFGIYYLPTMVFGIVFGAFAAVGAYEWAGFAGLEHPIGRSAYVAVTAVSAVLLYSIPAAHLPAVVVLCGIWGGAILSVLAYPRGAKVYARRWATAGLGVAVLGGAWLSLMLMHGSADGRLWLIWLFFLTSMTDIGAYFAGRAWGKRLLARSVSPAKTWEGAFGGAALASLVCGGALLVWRAEPVGWLLVMLGLIGLAVFGDLFESVLKRATGIKDSGSILPGHGGILDRMDSVIAVLPVMALVLRA